MGSHTTGTQYLQQGRNISVGFKGCISLYNTVKCIIVIVNNAVNEVGRRCREAQLSHCEKVVGLGLCGHSGLTVFTGDSKLSLLHLRESHICQDAFSPSDC